MCSRKIFFQSSFVTLSENWWKAKIRGREKSKFESTYFYQVPLSYPAARHNGESRISAESRIRLSIYLLVRVYTHARIHTRRCILRADMIAGSSMNGPSTVSYLGRIESGQRRWVNFAIERKRGDTKPSGSGHSRIIAHTRRARESRPELGAPSLATSVFSIARPAWSNPIAIVAADREPGGRPIWFTELVTTDYWILINLCASTNQARNRIVPSLVPGAFLSSSLPRVAIARADNGIDNWYISFARSAITRTVSANIVSDLSTRLLNVALRRAAFDY